VKFLNDKQCLVLHKMVFVCGYFSMVGLRLLHNEVTIGANSAVIIGWVLFYLPQGTNFLQLKILFSKAHLCRRNQAHQYSYLALKKKLDRRGKDRPPGIILRDRNMVPAEKTLEPGPPSLMVRSTAHSATAQPEGGVQDIDPRERLSHISCP
jgi:hypothetical protein